MINFKKIFNLIFIFGISVSIFFSCCTSSYASNRDIKNNIVDNVISSSTSSTSGLNETIDNINPFENLVIEDGSVEDSIIDDNISSGSSLSSGLSENAHWSDNLIENNNILTDKEVTLKDFEKKILTRLVEIVSFMQSISKPFCMILFILCAIGLLVSIIFNTNKQNMYILGLILSIIVYVGIAFAPEIVLYFANWLSF